MEKVVAIILNYNSFADCEKCLSYLCEQDYEELYIVIVDNASPKDGEKDHLIDLKVKFNCHLIFSEENAGFSAGNNLGLKWAYEQRADWALIINPDVELRDPHYISAVMKEKGKWERVVVIGTDVVLPSGNHQNPQRESTYWESVLWPLETIKGKIDGNKNRYLCDNITGYCEKVTGACFFISIPFISAIGYLDQRVFMYSEEAILAAQVKKEEYNTLYIAEIQAHHEHYSHQKAPSRDRMMLFIRSRLYYYKNYVPMNIMAYKLIQFSLWLEQKFLLLRSK